MRLEYRSNDLSTLFEYNLSILSQNVVYSVCDRLCTNDASLHRRDVDGLKKTDPNVVQEFLKEN